LNKTKSEGGGAGDAFKTFLGKNREERSTVGKGTGVEE
jgi:hypothetical protein